MNKTLTETLSDLGFTHHRNGNSDNTGKHTVEKNGVSIGEFTAKEAWEFVHLNSTQAPWLRE